MLKISEENQKIIKILMQTGYCLDTHSDERMPVSEDEFDMIDEECGGIYLDMGDNRIEYLMPFYTDNNYIPVLRESYQLNALAAFFEVVVSDAKQEGKTFIMRSPLLEDDMTSSHENPMFAKNECVKKCLSLWNGETDVYPDDPTFFKELKKKLKALDDDII